MKKSNVLINNLTAPLFQNQSETHYLNKDLTKETSSLCRVIVQGGSQGKNRFNHTNLVIEKKVFLEDQLSNIKVMLAQNKNRIRSFLL